MNCRVTAGLALIATALSIGRAHAEQATTGVETSVDVTGGQLSGPMKLSLEFDWGLSGRLEESDSGYFDDERAGLVLEGGVLFSPAPLFAVGLSYQRTQLGKEVARPGEVLAANTLFRRLNTVWLGLRAYPWQGEKVTPFIGLMVGPSWESSTGHITYPPAGVAGVMQSRSCSASGSAALALGATVGMDVDLGGGLALLARVTGGSHHLSSEPLVGLDGTYCGPGAGSASTLDARIGFAYSFGLGESAASPSAVAATQ